MTRRSAGKKVELAPRKTAWHPSPLLGQVVLVSSRNTAGEVHIAAKSWISMAASDPPTLYLSCRISHRTAIDILETREFVVNIPGAELSARVWRSAERPGGVLDGDAADWALAPAFKVAPPLLEECKAHLECVLDASHRLNAEEIALFGRILAVSVDEALLEGTAEDRYRNLKPLLYLEEGLYGSLDRPRRLES